MELSTIVLIILGLSGLVLLLFAVYIYIRESSTHEFSSTSSVSIQKLNSTNLDSTDPDSKNPQNRISDLGEQDKLPETRKLSQKDLPLEKRNTDSETNVPVNYFLQAQELEKKNELENAADIYQMLGRIDDELRVRSKLTPTQRLADLYLVDSLYNKQTSVLRILLQNSPQDQDLRLRVIKSILLEGKLDEAKDLLNIAMDEREDLNLNAEFFASVSNLFQSTLSFKEALRASTTASDMLQNNQKYACQVQYLDELLRLIEVSRDSTAHIKKNEVLKHAILESSSDIDLDGIDDDDSVSETSKGKPLEHRVLVGHFAQGYFRNLISHSDSLMRITPVDVMEFENVLSRREFSALFQTRDKLIDCPTVLRINRLFIKEQQYGLLRERFAVISKFSHPNISKIIYVDRIGPVFRKVTEYHQGGSLRSMVSQLKNIGIPFIVRMLLQISNGVLYAHKRGIIHGDLRPENILVGHDQLMKIGDFAIQPWPVHSPVVSGGIPKAECLIDLEKFGELCSYLIEHSISAEEDQTGQGDDLENARKIVLEIPEKISSEKIETMAGVQSELLNAMAHISG